MRASRVGSARYAVSGRSVRRLLMSNPVFTRQEVVEILRKAGLPEVAEEASRSLPDRVELERLAEFGRRHGITRDELISRMGGSP